MIKHVIITVTWW